MEDYYAILDLDRGASQESIKIAFRRLARHIHPDSQTRSSEDEKTLLSRQMAQLNEAYGVLHDAERRRAYDEQLRMLGLLTTKHTDATNEKKPVPTTHTRQRIRAPFETDSSAVRDFSSHVRTKILADYKDFSWKQRDLEGFDWALEASSWAVHFWIALRGFDSVSSAPVKRFITYADVAMARHNGGLRKSHFLFLLPFQQVREWDTVAVQCRRLVTVEARTGSSSAPAAILLVDVQHGKTLRFESQGPGKRLHQMTDWVATHL